MIFSCCDWERGREQPNDLENFSDSSDAFSQSNCNKRKEKSLRKDIQEPVSVFDIDSIMNPDAPNSTEKIMSAKRYFSQTKNNRRNSLRIQVPSVKIQKTDVSPAVVPSR